MFLNIFIFPASSYAILTQLLTCFPPPQSLSLDLVPSATSYTLQPLEVTVPEQKVYSDHNINFGPFEIRILQK